jgi:O-antigen/teichoic acid export membrane protein
MNIQSIALACCPLFLRPVLNSIANSPIGYRMATGVFWLMSASVISRGMGLIAWILVARMLGKAGYGELGMIQSTIGMFGVFAEFGLGLTATKFVAEFCRKDPERAGRIIGLSGIFTMVSGGLIAFILFVFAPWLAEHTINAPQLADVLRVSTLLMFIGALNSAQTGALSGFEAFKTIAYVNLFVGLISFPILLGGAYSGGVIGTVWAMIINCLVNCLINYVALRKEAQRYRVPLSLKHCTLEMSILYKFSLPAVLGSVIVTPVNWVCSALLVNQPDGYAEMGIFNAANQWQIAMLFIPSMLSQVTLPLLSSLNAESDGQQYRKVLILNIIVNAGIALVIAVPIVLFAHMIMSAYGAGFDQGTSVLSVLALATVLMAVNNVVGQAIASKGRMWIGFIFNILWAIALLSVTWMLIFNGQYRALGRASAILIAFVLHTVWQSIYLRRILNATGSKIS